MRRTTAKTPDATARVLAKLRQGRGAIVEVGDLIEAAYGHRADGGPAGAENCIRQSIAALRKAGYLIRRVSGYTLE